SDAEKDIFEAPSLEYRAYERLPPASADILTEVVRTLPEMLPEPETDPDSMFEDKAQEDYIGISTSTSPPMTSTQSLEILVAQKDYQQAERVLDELLEVGTKIPFSSAYEMAALAAIKVPARTLVEMEDQVKMFGKWFSLIPSADQTPGRRFRTLRRSILNSPLNSLKLIMEFGLIAAEKGYTGVTQQQAIGVVCMYGDPQHTLDYIAELRRRSRTFLAKFTLPGNVDRADRRLHIDMLGVAVRSLANAGRFDHAVQLVPDPLQTDTYLSHYTWLYLLNRLKKTKDPQYEPHINFVEQHKSEEKTSIQRPIASRRSTPRARPELYDADAVAFLETFAAEDVSMASSFPSQPPQLIMSNLATTLRALKQAFRALTPSHRPHPLTIVRFMELYLSTGRKRAISLLRNHVLKRPVDREVFVFAEMLFHARYGNPDLVIQTFVTHFYIVGLPRDDILLRLQKMELTDDDVALWGCTPPGKLYPSPVHTAAVWRTLLQFADEDRVMERLYASLLKFADPFVRTGSTLHPGVPHLLSPPGWKAGVDESAFTPFIRRMGMAYGPERGALVIREMIKLALTPTIYSLTELAMLYSRAGDIGKTFLILNQVESAKEENPQRRVDQVFYVAIARGFLISNQLRAALSVEQRMQQRYGKSGTSKPLVELYEDIQLAREGKPVPDREVRDSLDFWTTAPSNLLARSSSQSCITRDTSPRFFVCFYPVIPLVNPDILSRKHGLTRSSNPWTKKIWPSLRRSRLGRCSLFVYPSPPRFHLGPSHGTSGASELS
ncbi:hypothetical protein C8R46DRAFT_881358, partial [Mycena filopes]